MRIRIRDLFDLGSGIRAGNSPLEQKILDSNTFVASIPNRFQLFKHSPNDQENSDPGSGINIPDPQHWFLYIMLLCRNILTLFLADTHAQLGCKESNRITNNCNSCIFSYAQLLLSLRTKSCNMSKKFLAHSILRGGR
jgi:hypothetical protein